MKSSRASKKIAVGIKFTFYITIILCVVTTVGYLIAFNTLSEKLHSNINSEVLAFSKLATQPIVEVYDIYYDSGYLNFVEQLRRLLALSSDTIKQVQLINVNGTIEFDSNDLTGVTPKESKAFVDEVTKTRAKLAESSIIYADKDQTEIQEIIVPYYDQFNRHMYSVRYLVTYKSIQTALNQLAFQTGFVSLTLLVFTWMTVYFLTKKIFMNPLAILEDGIRRIEAGNFGHKISLKTGDNLEYLGTAFNKMSRQVQDSIEQLKDVDALKNEFINLTSHHFRTPIAIIKGWLEVIKKNNPTLGKSDAITAIDSSLDWLYALSEDLLSIAQLESSDKMFMRENINIIELVTTSFDKYSEKAKEKEVELTINKDSPRLLNFSGNKKFLQQAINQLIENAISYNKHGGSVVVTVSTNPDEPQTVLAIQDTGRGINKERAKTLFKPFHRGMDYMTADVEGEGLGLYLVKLVVSMHKGKVWFETEEDQGSTFYISLPINKEDQVRN